MMSVKKTGVILSIKILTKSEKYTEIYRKNTLAPNSYSYNIYGNKSTYHHGFIYSGAPTRPINYVPIFSKFSAHDHHPGYRTIPLIHSGGEDKNVCNTSPIIQ